MRTQNPQLIAARIGQLAGVFAGFAGAARADVETALVLLGDEDRRTLTDAGLIAANPRHRLAVSITLLGWEVVCWCAEHLEAPPALAPERFAALLSELVSAIED